MLDDIIIQIDDSKQFNLLAEGNTAQIYEYSSDEILKLFRQGMPKQAIQKEYEIVKKIQENFCDTPKTTGVVYFQNRYGILYEKVVGCDLMKILLSHPFQIKKNSQILAQVQLKMHKVEIDLANNLKQKLANEINSVSELTDDEKEKIIMKLKALPDGNRLCHCDFHPGNIMVSGNKYFIIDWMTACSGNPVADVSRTVLLLTYGEPMSASPFIRRILHLFFYLTKKCYVKQYIKKSGITYSQIKQWLVPIAAARLSEWLTEHERQVLLRFIRKNIDG